MKRLLAASVGLVLLGGAAFAAWDEANVRGLFPYFQSGGDWFTILMFVNASEETDDVVHIRFCDEHGPGCSDTMPPVFAIGERGQLIVSTAMGVGAWYPTTAGYGYIMFRIENGGFIHPYCVVINRLTWMGYTVPAYRQEHGF